MKLSSPKVMALVRIWRPPGLFQAACCVVQTPMAQIALLAGGAKAVLRSQRISLARWLACFLELDHRGWIALCRTRTQPGAHAGLA